MPYRDPPHQSDGPREGDPPSVIAAFRNRQRFGQLDSESLWPAASRVPFRNHATRHFAAASDGSRALLSFQSEPPTVWLLDCVSMVVVGRVEVPSQVSAVAISADGNFAAIRCAADLYRVDLRSQPSEWSPVLRIQTRSLHRNDQLLLSRDGRIAVGTSLSTSAAINVFDLDAGAQTYTLRADTDEGLVLHPSGALLICFGDDAFARSFNSSGLTSTITGSTGGGLSANGRFLVTNDKNDNRALRKFLISESGAFGEESVQRVGFEVELWNTKIAISPSGNSALVGDDDGGTRWVDLKKFGSREVQSRDVPLRMQEGAALISDQRALSNYEYTFGLEQESVRIVNCKASETEGLITLGLDTGTLVGLTVDGLYGSLVAGAGSLGDEAALPYERPAAISDALAGYGSRLADDDQLRFEEAVARRRAWSCVPRDQNRNLETDQLLEINRGLVELTAEIVHRGRKRSRDVKTRFGPWQLNMGALADAAAELRELHGARRDDVFREMVERERADPEQRLSLNSERKAWTEEKEHGRHPVVSGPMPPAVAPPPSLPSPLEVPVTVDEEVALIPLTNERSLAIPVTIGGFVLLLVALFVALSALL